MTTLIILSTIFKLLLLISSCNKMLLIIQQISVESINNIDESHFFNQINFTTPKEIFISIYYTMSCRQYSVKHGKLNLLTVFIIHNIKTPTRQVLKELNNFLYYKIPTQNNKNLSFLFQKLYYSFTKPNINNLFKYDFYSNKQVINYHP